VASEEFEFLGFAFRKSRATINVAAKSIQRFKHRIRELTARSRKGYWRMSKTIASGVGLTHAWLAEQGLFSMKPLWSELAPLRRTA